MTLASFLRINHILTKQNKRQGKTQSRPDIWEKMESKWKVLAFLKLTFLR